MIYVHAGNFLIFWRKGLLSCWQTYCIMCQNSHVYQCHMQRSSIIYINFWDISDSIVQCNLINPNAINPDALPLGWYFWGTKKKKTYQMWFIYPDASFIRTLNLLGTKVSGLTRLHCIEFNETWQHVCMMISVIDDLEKRE